MPPVEIRVPGDKSIAHRSLILGALAEGDTVLTQVPAGKDVLATQSCLLALGVRIERSGESVVIHGRGLKGMHTPAEPLDCRNSGTTMRLLTGALAGSSVTATLSGDASLQRRPMARVVEPLRAMGAEVDAPGGRAPIRIAGRRLTGRHHRLPVPSAQVKSALLLAGLQAEGVTRVEEPISTRDHTERLLLAMGATIRTDGLSVEVESTRQPLRPLHLDVPGDFSSAAFWLAAAAIRPGFCVCIDQLGLNPSRTGFLRMLEAMGAQVECEQRIALEPVGRVCVTGRSLHSVRVVAGEVAAAIDEIPVLMVVATQAGGTTSIEGAGELRVKESDRILAMTQGLRRMGARIDVLGDTIAVTGPTRLQPAEVDSFGDHRVAMALAIAGLATQGAHVITEPESADISYPGFFKQLELVARG